MVHFNPRIRVAFFLTGALGLILAALLLYLASTFVPGDLSFIALILISFLPALLFTLALSLLFTNKIQNTLRELERAARDLAAGNFAFNRVAFPGMRGETSKLAQTLDDLAKSLQKKMLYLSREKTKLEAAMEAMRIGVIISDGEGRVDYINEAAVKFFGTEKEKVTGFPLQAALRNFLLNENLEAVKRNGEPRTFDLNIFYPENRVLQVNMISISPGEDSAIDAVLTVLHDITGFRSLERMRSEFVDNVSHELRTPLTVIKGFAETLLDERNWHDPKKAGRILTMINKEAERLSRLLKDLLDLSQIESSKGVMKKQRVDLKRVVEEAAALLQSHSEAKGLEVKLIFPEQKLKNIKGDPDWLLQMFIDILDNAIKYTPRGGSIDITVQERGRELMVAVRDTGIGIPARNIPYIFERFYRVDKGRSRRLGGTGLGLAIVKHILEAHGGRVEVDSSVGVGTTFSIYLPLGPGEAD